jgi:hypothetical protein
MTLLQDDFSCHKVVLKREQCFAVINSADSHGVATDQPFSEYISLDGT